MQERFCIVMFIIGVCNTQSKMFEKSITLNPKGSEKWMFLGQMKNGAEAIACFERGISELHTSISEAVAKGADAAEVSALQDEMASAYCSIAEMYMTDLW